MQKSTNALVIEGLSYKNENYNEASERRMEGMKCVLLVTFCRIPFGMMFSYVWSLHLDDCKDQVEFNRW